jgi:hypothetical protein
MKLSIQFHSAGPPLSNTVSFLEVLGVERAWSTVHGKVLKADLQSALLCSTLLISESSFDGVFERFSSGFAVEFSSELERSEILCEAVF